MAGSDLCGWDAADGYSEHLGHKGPVWLDKHRPCGLTLQTLRHLKHCASRAVQAQPLVHACFRFNPMEAFQAIVSGRWDTS